MPFRLASWLGATVEAKVKLVSLSCNRAYLPCAFIVYIHFTILSISLLTIVKHPSVVTVPILHFVKPLSFTRNEALNCYVVQPGFSLNNDSAVNTIHTGGDLCSHRLLHRGKIIPNHSFSFSNQSSDFAITCPSISLYTFSNSG